MASKTKIYIVLELVTGGELFDKIVRQLLLQFLRCCVNDILVLSNEQRCWILCYLLDLG